MQFSRCRGADEGDKSGISAGGSDVAQRTTGTNCESGFRLYLPVDLSATAATCVRAPNGRRP